MLILGIINKKKPQQLEIPGGGGKLPPLPLQATALYSMYAKRQLNQDLDCVGSDRKIYRPIQFAGYFLLIECRPMNRSCYCRSI